MRIVLALFLLLFSTESVGAFPAREVRSGNSRYRQGDYTGAIEKYEQALEKAPESDIINFNLGTAFYKEGEWSKALEHLQKALLSDDRVIRQKGHYNLGNILYRYGAGQEDADIDKALASFEKSLFHFEEAVKLDSRDQDSRFYVDLLKKEIERLKKKRAQMPKQKKEGGKEGGGGDPQNQQPQSGQGRQENKDQNSQGQKPDAPPDQPPQSGEGDQPQDDQSSQSGQQPPSGDEDKKDKSGSAPQKDGMTPDEAKSLLDDYQQNEEPKGPLNFMKNSGGDQPVDKDW